MIIFPSPRLKPSEGLFILRDNSKNEQTGKESTLFTVDGRTALYLAVKALTENMINKKWLLPAYCCLSVYQVFLDAKVSCVFYPIKSNLQPDFDYLNDLLLKENNFSGILFIHYFGFQNDWSPIRSLLKEKNIKVIEDCAHRLIMSEGYSGSAPWDAQIYSLRKSYPLPHGGSLILNKSLISSHYQLKKANISIKKLLLNTLPSNLEDFFQLPIRGLMLSFPFMVRYLDKRDSTGNEYNFLMNPKVVSFFRKIYSSREIILKRQIENYFFLRELFQNDDRFQIFELNKVVDSPFVFSLLLPKDLRDKIYKRCLRRGIPVRVYWRSLPKPIIESPKLFHTSLEVSSRILNLPIHYQLNQLELSLIEKSLKT